jgi:hypothetical protein
MPNPGNNSNKVLLAILIAGIAAPFAKNLWDQRQAQKKKSGGGPLQEG